MMFVVKARSFLRNFFLSRRVEADLDQEVHSHLEMLTEENIRAGMPPQEAQRIARIELGGVELVKEQIRDQQIGNWLLSVLSDCRYGLQQLRKNPGFTAVAVLTLALGIGANTAIFSLVDALILRELPVFKPRQLVQIATADAKGERGGISLPMFLAIQQYQPQFSELFGWWGNGIFNVEFKHEYSTADIWAVTGNFYSSLGVAPYLGRLIEPDDVDLRGVTSPRAAVMGYEFWQRHYAGDPAVIGSIVRIAGHPFTIIGVTRQWFTAMTVGPVPDITVPLNAKALIEEGRSLDDRSSPWISAAVRMKDGITLEQVRAQMEALWPDVQSQTVPLGLNSEDLRDFLSTRIQVESAARGYEWFLRSRYTRPLFVLLGLGALVLLIACVNLASLLLARAMARTAEMGIRIALGAGRLRLVRQLLTESLLLSLAGAMLGLALAFWGSRMLANSIWFGLVPLTIDFSPDLRVVAFTVGLAVLIGILFGIGPAWSVTKQDPLSALKLTARISAGRSGRVAKLLICTQVALSLVLLTGAGLFMRSLAILRSIDPGYQSRGVLLVELFPRPGVEKTTKNEIFFPQLIARIAELPGVRSASLSDFRPAWGFGGKETVVDEPADAASSGTREAQFATVSPQFFETLGIAQIEGRAFSWRDDATATPVAILSRTLAQQLFPSGQAIGRHIRIGSGPKLRHLEVVGIVNDARIADVHDPDLQAAYIPFLQDLSNAPWSTLEVKTIGDPAAMALAVRQEIDQFGHESVLLTKTLSEMKDIALSRERLIVHISVFFGSLALFLAALGLFGLMAYLIRGRTREIGIRMAVGAQRQEVGSMILRETLFLVLLGMAIGIPCALAATRVLASLLFGVSPSDPLTLTLVALMMLLVGAAAGWIPAMRAQRIDPIVALRHE